MSYKIKQDSGEILMAHAGESLDNWSDPKYTKKQRMAFVVEMLNQLIPALKTLHDVGFSHGDIKHENICA